MKSEFLYIYRSEHPVPIKKAFGAKIAFFHKIIDESSKEVEMRGRLGGSVKLII
jgi:hypothetical protein